MKKSILSAHEAQIIATAVANGCEASKVVSAAISGEVINPEDWTKTSSSPEVSKVLFKVKDAYNEDLTQKYGTTKDRNIEFKGFKEGLKHIAAVRKILMLDIKNESGKSNVLTVALIKQLEKVIEQKTKSLPLCTITSKPILTSGLKGETLQYMERNVFALTGNLTFIEALKQTQNGNGYNITLLRNLYERFNALPFAKHDDVYSLAYELNTIFNKSEFDKDDFLHVCELFGFDVNESETFATFAGMGQKVLAKLVLNFHPFYFAKNYTKFMETFKDGKGEKPGAAFQRYVTEVLEFPTLEVFLETIKSATVGQTLKEATESNFEAKAGEVKEAPKQTTAQKAAATKAANKAAAKEAKEAQEREAKLSNLLEQRTKCIEKREMLVNSEDSEAAAQLLELDILDVNIQDALNELQGLNEALSPITVVLS